MYKIKGLSHKNFYYATTLLVLLEVYLMNKAIYKNSAYSIEDRVNDLLSRMTLEEKVMQLCGELPSNFIVKGKIDYNKLKSFGKNGYGRITQYSLVGLVNPDKIVKISNEIQKFFVEETRLGIPVILQSESLAGYPGKNGTIFPSMLNVASTWDTDLIKKMGEITGEECNAVGINTVMSPVVDISRDLRWGRCYETFGEDVYLTTQMGINYVKGMQSKNVSCIAKHFLGYAETQGGLNTAVTRLNKKELYEIFATPFEAMDKTVALDGIMASYSEIDGLPVGCNKEIIDDLLRKTMGFKGLLTSDGAAIWKIYDYFKLTRSYKEAGLLAKKAGLDTEIPIGGAYRYLVDFVKNKQLDENIIDISVKRVLNIKFKLGLFEKPYIEEKNVFNRLTDVSKRIFSREIADNSIVLLSNKGNILPLNITYKIALIGPHADSKRYPISGYSYPAYIEMLQSLKNDRKKDISFNGIIDEENKSYDNQGFNTMYNIFQDDDWNYLNDMNKILDDIQADTLKEELETFYQVSYCKGCDISDIKINDIENACQIAKKSDVIILTVGGNCGWVNVTIGEGKDRCTLNLPGLQEELLVKLQMTNKPIILIMYGTIYNIPSIKNIKAILYAGLPGPYSGKSLTGILNGSINPSGKLPITVPRSVGQIPIYYNHKVGSGYHSIGDKAMTTIFSGGYIDDEYSPLYPFGFGLSYTTFYIDDIKVRNKTINLGSDIILSCRIKNIGSVTGSEVIQIYYYFKDAHVIRPNRQLIAFKKIMLKPDEIKTVIFTINTRQLGYYNEEMQFVIEPGQADLMIGTSSENIIYTTEINLIGKTLNILGKREYISKAEILKSI